MTSFERWLRAAVNPEKRPDGSWVDLDNGVAFVEGDHLDDTPSEPEPPSSK